MGLQKRTKDVGCVGGKGRRRGKSIKTWRSFVPFCPFPNYFITFFFVGKERRRIVGYRRRWGVQVSPCLLSLATTKQTASSYLIARKLVATKKGQYAGEEKLIVNFAYPSDIFPDALQTIAKKKGGQRGGGGKKMKTKKKKSPWDMDAQVILGNGTTK